MRCDPTGLQELATPHTVIGLRASIFVVKVVSLILAAVVPPVAGAQQPTAVAASIVFEGVTIVDVEQGRLRPNQRVVIAGNRIQTVGKAGAVKMPLGANVVDARGKYLIPGLWDMHAHPMRLAADFYYPLFVANGVTGIRDAGSGVPIDTLLLWRKEILSGARVGPPRQLLSGQSISAPGCEVGAGPGSTETCLADSAAVVHYVDSLRAAGADMIKPRAVDRAMYFLIAAEARRQSIPFGGHVHQVTALEASDSGASIIDHKGDLGAEEIGEGCPTFTDLLTKIGQDSIAFARAAVERVSLDSLIFLKGSDSSIAQAAKRIQRIRRAQEQCYENNQQKTAERLRRNGTWLVPTYAVRWEGLFAKSLAHRADELWAGVPRSDNWLRDPTTVTPGSSMIASSGSMKDARRFGFPLLAGTDTHEANMVQQPPGFSLHMELAIYVTEGLTPLAALQAATLNPAKMLHGSDSLGTVAQGKLADLVLLDADPLADITNTTTIRAVVADGRYFDRAALDALMLSVQRLKASQRLGPEP